MRTRKTIITVTTDDAGMNKIHTSYEDSDVAEHNKSIQNLEHGLHNMLKMMNQGVASVVAQSSEPFPVLEQVMDAMKKDIQAILNLAGNRSVELERRDIENSN